MSIFKKDFYWGNSVSSMQTEGAWDQGGKGLSVYDVREATEESSDWKVATDSYHRYIEDFDLMKEMGMNCYRFQISWSRVNPTGDGEFNEEGIAFYDKFIDDLIERGIEPMICLYHFDMPLNLAENYNGFLSRHVVDAFLRYGQEMLKRFGHKVKYWVTLNEQNLYSTPKGFRYGGYLKGEETLEELYMISHNVMMAHTLFSNYLHDNYPKCEVGGMLTYMEAYPATSKPEDVFAARQADEYLNHNLLEVYTNGTYSKEVLRFMELNNLLHVILEEDYSEMKRLKSDWIAFSYYASHALSAEKIPEGTPVNYYLTTGVVKNEHVEATPRWGWQIDPLGFRNILTKLYNRYELPLFPIENGIGVEEEWDGINPIDDQYRIEYHRDHIKAMRDAVEFDGVEVLGYLGWGLIDILSSQGDMRKRYGMVYVNRTNHDMRDLKRVPKKSFEWMKKVTASNGQNL